MTYFLILRRSSWYLPIAGVQKIRFTWNSPNFDQKVTLLVSTRHVLYSPCKSCTCRQRPWSTEPSDASEEGGDIGGPKKFRGHELHLSRRKWHHLSLQTVSPILLMEEILHQLIGGLSQYLQGCLGFLPSTVSLEFFNISPNLEIPRNTRKLPM